MQALLFFYHSVITGLPLTLCLEHSLWLVNRMSGLTLVKTTSLIYCQSLFSICRLQPQYGSLYQGRRQCSVSPPFFHLNHHINHSYHLLAPSVVTYCFLSCRFWGSRRKKVKWGIWRDLTWSCTIISWLCALWVQCFLSWALRDPCVPFTPADEPLISFLGQTEPSRKRLDAQTWRRNPSLHDLPEKRLVVHLLVWREHRGPSRLMKENTGPKGHRVS